jgi:hypothetical protein
MPKRQRNKARKASRKKSSNTTASVRVASEQSQLRSVHSIETRKPLYGALRSSLRRSLNPLPTSMRVVFAGNLAGSVATGAATSAVFTVKANSIRLPFDGSGYGGTDLPNPIGGVNTNTWTPAGWTLFFASTTQAAYLRYRVVASAISVEMLSSAAADNFKFVIVPSGLGNDVGASVETAGQSRFSVSRIGGFGNGGRVILENQLSVPEVLGETWETILGDETFAGTQGADPTQFLGWNIWYGTLQGGVLAAPLCYNVRVSWDVIMEEAQWANNSLANVSSSGDEKFDSTSSAVIKKADVIRTSLRRDTTMEYFQQEEPDDTSSCSSRSSSSSGVKVKNPSKTK